MADLSTWMKTFKDKMDDKSYRLSLTSSSPGPFSVASKVGREKALASAGHMTNKHPNNFFSIKANHCVFELSVPCACLFHCVIATEFDYRIQCNRFRLALHAVDSLNVKHELRSKKTKQFCIMQAFPNDISRFAT